MMTGRRDANRRQQPIKDITKEGDPTFPAPHSGSAVQVPSLRLWILVKVSRAFCSKYGTKTKKKKDHRRCGPLRASRLIVPNSVASLFGCAAAASPASYDGACWYTFRHNLIRTRGGGVECGRVDREGVSTAPSTPTTRDRPLHNQATSRCVRPTQLTVGCGTNGPRFIP
jgi:hypothetical protein